MKLFQAAAWSIAWLCVPFAMNAQTTVTLTVDMSNEVVSPFGVCVVGNFQGWAPGATPMTDNGDGTYSHTFTTDTAATYEYKFINGNAWGSHESVPSACAFNGNRQVVVDGTMGDVSILACYGNCAACDLKTVRFRVDMTNEEVSPFGVHVAGNFQGWDPAGTELTDPDGDMVYETIQTVPDTVDQLVFKFINGSDWVDQLDFVDAACGDESGNRVLVLDSLAGRDVVMSADDFGSPYCFNTCSACVLPLGVTFTIDMMNIPVSENGVHLAGSFQGWDPAGTPLTDNGDGTWSVTVEMAPGTYEFKFINSNAWDGNEENLEGSGCNNGQNRIATFDADNNTYAACFNACPGELCIPNPDPADVTFRVNTADQDLLEGDLVYVWGSFTGWQNGAKAMTDADGDGVWEHTENISGDANIHYKYSIGHPTANGAIEEDGVFIVDGDTTNFEAAGCGTGNGFGGYERRHVRSGTAEILEVVCFNSCGACLNVIGCTDSAACNYNPEATIDNGTCTTACGCTDPNACNYDVTAIADDGSCCTCVESVHPLGLLNQTWRFSPEEGAIAIGPEPLSTEWYASPAGGVVDFQYDDRWTFTALGSMVYDNNGSTMNPFDGFIETVMTVEPTTFEYAPAGPFLGLPAITISPMLTEVSELCGWFGVWNSGPTYEVVELTDSTLVVLALQQEGDCVNPYGGYFTLKFVAADPQNVTGADGAIDGICITGCLDPNACNYIPQAEYDSGNCNYSCLGCTDAEAFNFNEEATLNDGSCFYTSCDDLGNPLWAAYADIGLHVPTTETLVHGIGVSTQWVLNLPTVIQEPSSQQLFATHSWTGLVLSGLPTGLTPDTAGVELSLGGSEQACVAIAGVPEMPGTYDVEATGSLAVSVFGSPFEIGPFTTVTSVTVLPNPNPIPGCTYEGAVNFAGYANLENGSCVYEGCTDPEALNYYPFITVDDGSCLYGDVIGPSCPSDIDQDGTVTTSDLLNLLSSFGLECQ